jgi:hypothetical protein
LKYPLYYLDNNVVEHHLLIGKGRHGDSQIHKNKKPARGAPAFSLKLQKYRFTKGKLAHVLPQHFAYRVTTQ